MGRPSLGCRARGGGIAAATVARQGPSTMAALVPLLLMVAAALGGGSAAAAAASASASASAEGMTWTSDSIQQPYREAVMADEPWAYWPLGTIDTVPNPELGPSQGKHGPVKGRYVAIDRSKRTTTSTGRFWGWTEDTSDCDSPPCVMPSNQTRDDDGFLRLNPAGRVVVPSFYLPPAQSFTLEMWISPTCDTDSSSTRQQVLRSLNASTMYTPLVWLDAGRVSLHVSANDPWSNISYFAQMAVASCGHGYISGGDWHHVTFVFNGSSVTGFLNGTAGKSVHLLGDSQLGLPCPWGTKPRCQGTQGLIFGQGLNGAIRDVAVYDKALSPEAIMVHTRAFSDSWIGGVVWPGAEACAAGEGLLEGASFWSSSAIATMVMFFALFGLVASLNLKDALPLPPRLILGSASLFLAAAYLSIPIGAPSVYATDGEPIFPAQFLFWSVMECGGCMLLITSCNRVGRTSAMLLLIASAVSVCLAFLACLYPPEIICSNAEDGLLKPEQCAMAESFPLVVAALLSLVPQWVLIVGPTTLPEFGLGEALGSLVLGSERELPGEGGDGDRGRGQDGGASGQGTSQVDGDDDEEEESIAQDGGIRSFAKRSRSLLLSRQTGHSPQPLDTLSSFTSKIALWHFASASLRRVTWLVSVEEREPRLPPPLKLAFQALTDGASLCGLALLLLRAAQLAGGEGSKEGQGEGGEQQGGGSSRSFRDIFRLTGGVSSPGLRRGASFHSINAPEEEEEEEEREGGREEKEKEGEAGRHAWGGISRADNVANPLGAQSSVRSDSSLDPLLPRLSRGEMMSGGSKLGGGGRVVVEGAEDESWRSSELSQGGGGLLDSAGEAILVQQLRDNGYMVWKDEETGDIKAVHGGDFASASRICAVFLIIMCIIISSLLCLDAGIAGVGLGGRITCWTTLKDLESNSGEEIPTDGDRLLLSCPSGCGTRQHRDPSIKSKGGGGDRWGPLPLWGWNDIYGGDDDIYAPGSSLCRAAVHAGLVSQQVSSCFALQAVPPRALYPGSTRNGVSSSTLNLANSTIDTTDPAARLIHSPTICPFSLYRYAAGCLVPIMIAYALLAPPPFFFWLATVSVAYWFEALLGADPWSNVHIVHGERGWHPLLGFLAVLCFAPAVYLLGPVYVIKAPCWQSHLPTDVSNRKMLDGAGGGKETGHISTPRAARSIRELLVRNILCFFFPMLLGCRIEAYFNKTLLAGMSTTFDRSSDILKGGNDPIYLLSPFVVIASLSLLRSVGVGWRGADILRYCWATAALSTCLWLCTLLLEGYKLLTLGHFWFISFLIPVTAHDYNISSVVQAILLGMAVQCIYMGDGISPWTYASPSNY